MKIFTWVGRVEGASYLLLFFVAMPLKYGLELPAMVKVVGRAHGVLVVAFLVTLALAARASKWSARRVAWAFISSMVPLGFVFFEASLKAEREQPEG
jgi:integral membrane protein